MDQKRINCNSSLKCTYSNIVCKLCMCMYSSCCMAMLYIYSNIMIVLYVQPLGILYINVQRIRLSKSIWTQFCALVCTAWSIIEQGLG